VLINVPRIIAAGPLSEQLTGKARHMSETEQKMSI